MRRWLKRIGLSVVALVILAAAALPAVVGIRPIIGPRARALTDRTFESTPERLERGRYLATSVSLCLACHSEIDWSSFTIKPGTEGSGRSCADEGLPFLTVPNITPDAETGAGTVDRRHARARHSRRYRERRPYAFSADAVPPVQVHGGRGSRVDRGVPTFAAARAETVAALGDSVPRESFHQCGARTGHRHPYRRRTGTIRSRTATTWFASAYAATVTHLPMRRARRFPAWSSAADFHSSARWEKSRAGTLPPLQAAFLITRKNSLSK